jgi:hypothetical protein
MCNAGCSHSHVPTQVLETGLQIGTLFLALRPREFGVVASMFVQSHESVFDQPVQLVCSAIDRLVYGCRMMCDRDGLAAFEAGF